ncbi:MAG: nuclear transport factor 2 family protein [Nevskia sp.]|nr:nuclear transport factor 2 family protein [Nevskia sp.]
MQADDYFAIQNLIHRYARCIDRGDFAGATRLFARAEVHMPARAEPYVNDPDGLLTLWLAMVRIDAQTGTPRTQHLMSNIIIEPDGDERARAQTYGTVLQATPSLPLQPIATVTYHDRFAKDDTGWYFTARRLELNLLGNLGEHLLG